MTKKGITYCLIPVLAFLISCAHRPHRQASSPVEIAGERMIIGPVAYEDILEYFPAWKKADEHAQSTDEVISGIKGINIPLDIQCFLGTWCSDSRQEVPPFMKSLALAGNPHIRIELYGVDRQKDDPDHLGTANNIEWVPTFIVKRDGVEIFRMVEFPETTFAEDLLTNLKMIK
jgi:thiol-disulfide isomerase/thioredoxin